MLIAGVDIGNSTTEVCIADRREDGSIRFLATGVTKTTGPKGTPGNLKGIKEVLDQSLGSIDKKLSDLELIRINEAAPVIGDTAMETITETIITESTMIGHNPDTPAGEGLAVGTTVLISDLDSCKEKDIIVVVTPDWDYERSAVTINRYGLNVRGAIVKKDEAVLIYNRLQIKIPIVDEILNIDRIPLNMKAVIEVATPGRSIRVLSNPYGLAQIFTLTPEETKHVIPIAKSLIGNRSAVVIRTPKGAVKERSIPAGILTVWDTAGSSTEIPIDSGATAIMESLAKTGHIYNIEGSPDSHVGRMLERMKKELSALSNQEAGSLKIKDLLAVDTFVPMDVKGALAGEVSMEKAVAIATMVKAEKLPMEKLANLLEHQLKVPVKVAGVEAVMATLGALTTQGVTLPLAILDLGGGSTDGAVLDKDGMVTAMHLAGAGEFITMMIGKELSLERNIAEEIKMSPLAKVESLYHIRMENGEVIFFPQPLEPKFFGRVVVVKEKTMIPIDTKHSMERIAETRRRIKKEVFVKNALRALSMIAPQGNLRNVPNVVMVGGSALDFEIPEMVLQELAHLKITVGRGEIRGNCGPRNAVATGLVLL